MGNFLRNPPFLKSATVQRITLPCTKHGRRRIVFVSSTDQCKMAAMRDFARPLRLHRRFPRINTEIESLKELTVTVTLTVPLTLTPNHRCQPSRNHAGNPAFWRISRIFARTSCISGFISKFKKSLKSNNFSCMETFCSKKICKNVSDSVTRY